MLKAATAADHILGPARADSANGKVAKRLSMKTGERETIAEHLKKSGCRGAAFCNSVPHSSAAPVGLSLTRQATAAQVARIVGKARRPSVVWLPFRTARMHGALSGPRHRTSRI
jgi:hypothetical protein